MWTAEELEKLRKAGKIASEVRSYAERCVREGVRILDICESLEEEIRRRGAKPAFPCNIGIDWVGAHYTSPLGDTSCIPPNSLVKVDIGAHIDGYISDTAISICLNPEYMVLKQATEEALRAALKVIKPGMKTSEVGAVIQNTIQKYGLKVIRNLTGHGISRYIIHTGKVLPNVGMPIGPRLEEGEIYGVEPFATTQKGGGLVFEDKSVHIYRVIKEKQPKGESARGILQYIRENYRTLPFAKRWIFKAFPREDTNAAFEELVEGRFIRGYPVLVESKREPIAQSEHTILVTRDGCEVLTF
ncbi:MAG: type II methionyl aminopeptidase [Candidatus Bathyarchaeia archaeon]